MARLNVQRLSFGMSLVGFAMLAAAACSSSSSEEKKAAGVSQACTLNSDCSDPLVCAFQRCHQQCTQTRDCATGQRCVKQSTKVSGEGGAGDSLVGVCQLTVEKTCATGGAKCATGQQCAEDKQCHDVCTSDDECVNKQTCTPNGSCADSGETDSTTGNIKPGGASGSGGTGGTGGTGMNTAGENGQSTGLGGENGGTTVNECPDTKGNNPEMHAGENIMTDVSWSGLHRVTGALYVGATLELKPCTVVQVDQGANIVLSTGGSIHALGVAGNPVVFTSAKSPPAAGDWGGINIPAAAGNDSTFQNVIIEYGGQYTSPLTVNNGAKASLTNVLVRHTDPDTDAIKLDSGAEIVKFVGVSTEDSKLGLHVAANTVGLLDSFTSDAAAITVDAETMTEDSTWKDFGVPYVLTGSFYLQSVLALDPGVTIKMPAGAWLDVNGSGSHAGSLQAVGTKDKPVTFTSAKKSPAAGDWGYLEFDATSSNDSVLDHAVLEYGGDYMVQVQGGASLGITNSTFQHSDDSNGGCAVYWMQNARITAFEGNTFKDTPCPLYVPASLVGEIGDFTADADSGDVNVLPEQLMKPVTWDDHGAPYHLIGSMYVYSRWQLNEGVTVKMPSGGWIDAAGGGSIKIAGTKDAPVTFRSFIDDAGDGDWQYIEINGDAAESSVFTYAVIKDSAQGIYINANKLTLDHCTFENNTCDIQADTTSEVTFTSTEVNACK